MSMSMERFAQERAALNAIQGRGMVFNSIGYYSRVRFRITRTGASPNYTYTLTQGTAIRAFSYGVTQPMNGAGFASTDLGTAADTNLLKPYTTLAGQDVRIKGLSILVNSNTDFEFLRVAAPEISVRLGVNGDGDTYKLGSVQNLPSFGGLNGWGDTQVKTPDFDSVRAFAYLGSNGLPSAGDFRPYSEGIWWRREGEPDGTLNITLTAERTVTITGLADRAAAAGIQAYAPPATIDLDFTIHLVTDNGGPQSVNR